MDKPQEFKTDDPIIPLDDAETTKEFISRLTLTIILGVIVGLFMYVIR